MICRKAEDALRGGELESPFDSVIVDEVQDLSPPALRFVAALAQEHPELMMLVGDAGQRIYPGGFSLKALGIDVRGRSKILRINYRTTEQIRRHADRVLGDASDDLDGGVESRNATRSLLRGPEPVLEGFGKAEEQQAFVVDRISKWIADGLEPEEIAVFARVGKWVEPIKGALEQKGIPVHTLSREQSGPGVNFGTMHRAKGLEFKAVLAVDCADNRVPLRSVVARARETGDETTALELERQLLYVTMTRARDELIITWSGQPSRFLEALLTGHRQGTSL